VNVRVAFGFSRSLLLVLFLGSAVACGSSGEGIRDGGGPEGGGDVLASGCPAQHPAFGATCVGALSCEYGKSSCCGIETSAQTCTCQNGFFSCDQTVECNVVCPDAGRG
jgi:hypothetical protein